MRAPLLTPSVRLIPPVLGLLLATGCVPKLPPSDGTTDTALGTDSAADRAPEGLVVGITPTNPAAGDALTAAILTDAVDPDGDAVAYTYAWTVNGAASSVTANAIPASTTARLDVWAVSVTPSDGTLLGTPATASVTVGETAPVVSVTLSPDPAYLDSTLVAAPVASDADGDPVALTWVWTVNSIVVDSATTDTLPATVLKKGDAVGVSVTPNDGYEDGLVATASLTIANAAPTGTGVTILPATLRIGDTATCTPTGYADLDHDPEGWTYTWTVDGVDSGATGPTFSAFLHGDVLDCTATPFDGTDAGVALIAAPVTVSNTAPTLDAVSISPASPTVTDELTALPGTADDADADALSLSYAWTVNGTSVPSDPSDATGASLAPGSFRKGDNVIVTATATDELGLVGAPVASAPVTVVNSAPYLNTVSVSPNPAYTNDELSVSVLGDDADGDALSTTYAWYVDGAPVGTDGTLDGSAFSKGESVWVVVTPSDGTTDGTPVSSTPFTISDSAPSGTGVVVSPSSATESSTLTCVPSGYSDADGDAEGWTYVWTADATTVATTATIDGTYFDRDQFVTCKATPYDGEKSGSELDGVGLTIANTPPTLSKVSVLPAHPVHGDTLTASLGTESDADGDPINESYVWYVDAVAVAATPTLASTLYHKDQLIYVVATPTDGTDAGTPVTSATITAKNSPPVISLVSVTPTTAYTNDTLAVAVTASDADSDGITYTYGWKVNGSGVGGTSDTSLSGVTYFERDDVVTVTVTPSDGETLGTAVTSTPITIADSPPTAPVSIRMTPAEPLTGDALHCTVVTGGTDDDAGDTLSYVFTWDNGSAYTGATTLGKSSIVPGTDVTGDADWTCSVQTSDGTLTSSAVTDDVVSSYACSNGGAVSLVGGAPEFQAVCGGTFEMGCTGGQISCSPSTDPRSVTLTNDVWIGLTEVTQGQYFAVTGSRPSDFSTCGDSCPVETVSWYQAAKYANDLSDDAGYAECYTCTGSDATSDLSCVEAGDIYLCEGFRLPTEAEWENAARCGDDTSYSGASLLGAVAWYADNSGYTPHAVGTKTANACGIYDMTGNLWEQTNDWFDAYDAGPDTDPEGAAASTGYRVIRGGGWLDPDYQQDVAWRNYHEPSYPDFNTGFRVARTVQ